MNSNKNILVTGADGFIGSHLVELLHDQGYSVRALSYYNSFNNWGWLEHVNCKDSIEIVTGDVRDANFCEHVCSGIDKVFHLAALIAIPYSYIAPESFIDTNIKGTLNILNASNKNKVGKILITSTSEVYGSAKYVPMDEKHPLQAQSPYSASKISADAIAKSFYNSFETPVIIVRPFNTFGPRQSARAVIPNIISQIASGTESVSLGDVTPTRDFIFVEDTCRAFLEISMEDGLIGKTINIGSGEEISIQGLFEKISNIMNSNVTIKQEKERRRPKNSEVERLLADVTLLSQMTKFKKKYTFEQGLKITVDWFTQPENLSHYKTDIFNL